MEIKAKVFTVSRINAYVRSLLGGDALLSGFFCEGEVSNLKYHGSGHVYFSLKDELASVNCVMWKNNAQALKFRLQEGMKLILYGAVSVYEKTGVYQIYAEFAEPLGKGSLSLAFDQLREKLRLEGLFDADRKRPIPTYADQVAVISSGTGAVIEDITNIARRKNRVTKLLLCPAAVQGAEAARSITEALRAINSLGAADVIIIARGGGSAEDLAPFNDEALTRAVAASKIPVISAVGHQTDFTLCDFAADLRAETPSAAAEIAFYDEEQLRDGLDYLAERMKSAVSEKLRRPEFETLAGRLRESAETALVRKRALYGQSVAMLESLSPLNVLKRGYVMAFKNASPLSSAAGLRHGDEIELRFRDGDVAALINERREHAQN